MYRIDNARSIHSPHGSMLTARSWLTEAPMRMLMNNLDPDVAERPGELVVYGGIGRAARDWESFDRIVASLKTISEDGGFELKNLMRGNEALPVPKLRAIIDRDLYHRTPGRIPCGDVVEFG